MTDQVPELFWEATYAIVVALMEHHFVRDPEEVGLNELADMVQSLPGFNDDPGLVTERILLDIQILWYEETMSL